MTPNINHTPDIKLSIKQTFGIESDMEVDAFSKSSEYVPEIDKTYKFDKDTTLAILSGFSFSTPFSTASNWGIWPWISE